MLIVGHMEISSSIRLRIVRLVNYIIKYIVSQKTPTNCDNYGERGPILIILSLLNSEMNCRKRAIKICTSPQIRCRITLRNLNVQLYNCSYQRWSRVSGSRVTGWPILAGSGRVTDQCVRPGVWPGFEFKHARLSWRCVYRVTPSRQNNLRFRFRFGSHHIIFYWLPYFS